MEKEKEKVLVFRDENKIKKHRSELEAALPLLQQTIDHAKGIGVEILMEKLSDTRMTPIHVVRDHFEKTIKVPAKVNGLPTNRRAYLEKEMATMELPDSDAFEKSLKKFRDAVKNNMAYNDFEIVNGVAGINEKAFDSFCEHFTIYADTEKGKKLWDALSKMVDGMNDFNLIARDECNIKMAADPHNLFHYVTTTSEMKIEDRKIIPIVGMWLELTKINKL